MFVSFENKKKYDSFIYDLILNESMYSFKLK